MGMRKFFLVGRKIIGVGSNYQCHIQEMGSKLPSEPIFFLKPTSSYVLEPNPILLPEGHEVHHEMEMGVVIGKGGANIEVKDAPMQIAGVCLALDLTARNLQLEAKAQGLPWTIAKGFDTFCPISAYLPRACFIDPMRLEMELRVNGQVRQRCNTSEMIFNVYELISRISKVMRLDPGDMILTGTPKGVGPLAVGDIVEGHLGGQDTIRMRFKCATKPLRMHSHRFH